MHFVVESTGPNIARVASLIGDPARAEILTALMLDRALTATELAHIAGITKQSISAHLSKLLDAGLAYAERQGRHRYFRLSNADVAQLLEALIGVAPRTGSVRLLNSPHEPALRKARTCSDHLAGELGVLAQETLRQRQFLLTDADGGLSPAAEGQAWLASVSSSLAWNGRRAYCRACLNWNERRHHIGGHVGAVLLHYVLKKGRAK